MCKFLKIPKHLTKNMMEEWVKIHVQKSKANKKEI